MSEVSFGQRPMLIGSRHPSVDVWRPVHSPFDGRVIGEIPSANEHDIDDAVDTARQALSASEFPTFERAAVLDRAAQYLQAQHETFAQTISAEAAKPIRTARIEASRAIDTVRFSAAVARTMHGELVPMNASAAGHGTWGLVRRRPVGVLAAITPFNFPLNLVCHKVAPAIAAGCPVVLKPASATPFSSLLLADLLTEAGLPPGWLNVVTAPGSVADHLVTHPDVAMITFTGSAAVGWQIRERAPKKRVSLELGNNAPLIVHRDGDWQRAVDGVKTAGFAHAGQSCISTQRIYVHETIAEPFIERLVANVGALKLGDPSDESTDVSTLIDQGETDRVQSWIGEAADEGADVLIGGGRLGRLLEPTVLSGILPGMKVSDREVFGPVVGVATYSDLDAALRLADDSVYGLQAAIFTADIDTAFYAADRLHYGGVLINEMPTWRADQMPYGGDRDSGNTREGPAWAARSMTEEQLIVIRQNKPPLDL